MSLETRYAETCVLIHATRRSADSESAVRAIAALLRERHPELLGAGKVVLSEEHRSEILATDEEVIAASRGGGGLAASDIIRMVLDHATAIPVEPPWTPVAEGLPEREGYYLVTAESEWPFGGKREAHTCRWEALTGEDDDEPGVWLGLPLYFTSHDVLAWRPAPKPWDGGGA